APFLEGRPLRARDRGPETLGRAAAYLGWLGREAACGEALAGDELFPMIRRNVELTLGPAGARRLGRPGGWRPRLRGAAKIAVDGRMAPHEWIRTGDALLKTDAVDHHDDHFLPGPTDLAWDVAGFSVEWGLAPDAARAFADEAARRARDPGLPDR